MGSSIAQAAAQNDFHVILYDVSTGMLEKARTAMESNLQTLVQKNKITAQAGAAILGRIQFVSDINDCLADLIIELFPVNLAWINKGRNYLGLFVETEFIRIYCDSVEFLVTHYRNNILLTTIPPSVYLN